MATQERLQELITIVGECKDFFIDRDMILERFRNGQCSVCGKKPDESKIIDEESRKEFDLSHMCQPCQNATFTGKVINGIRQAMVQLEGQPREKTTSTCSRLKTGSAV